MANNINSSYCCNSYYTPNCEPAIIGSIQNSSSNVVCSSSHNNAFNQFLSEDLLAGMRQNGNMSVIRRFFCLFVTFDLLLTSLILLICLMLSDKLDFHKILEDQILHYSITTSLFDIEMVALLRFVILLLYYSIIQIDHWVVVALTTAGTCAFLIAKVYFFKWVLIRQTELQVILILSSFILSWTEAWLLDLRVVPQEKNARDYIIAALNCNQTSPLLQRFLTTAKFDALSESIGSRFYSPVITPEDSDDERDGPSTPRIVLGPADFLVYKEKANEIFENALTTLNSSPWKLEKTHTSGDSILSHKLTDGSKIFLLMGKVKAELTTLLDVLHARVEELPSWNPTVKESKILQTIDENTDLTYQVSAGVAGGAIKSRDFVLLRHLRVVDGVTVIATASIESRIAPVREEYVRGENGPGCWALKQVPNTSFPLCEVQWVLNSKIKGWIPVSLVESAVINVMLDYMSLLRKYISNSE